MSSLWNAKVEAVDGARVTLRLTAVHPDAGDPPESAVFALRLLVDGLERAADAPAAAARLDSLSTPEGAGQAVADVSVTERRNLPFDERAAKHAIKTELRERGQDPAETSDAFQARWRDLWEDPRQAPSARLTVHLRDAGAVAGLKPGHAWESAAFG
ncbi:hypothetical protein [Streptomyces daliensis]